MEPPKQTELWIDVEGLALAFMILLFASLVIMFLVIPVKMANRRGRSATMWFLISIIFSPFLSMLFLALLGETDEKRHERIREEERLRSLYRH